MSFMQARFILSLLFATIVAIFALKNANEVLIDFIFNKVYISQALIIFISAILGAVIVAILGSIKIFKLKKELKELMMKLLKKIIKLDLDHQPMIIVENLSMLREL